MELLRQTARFAAEDQNNSAGSAKRRLPEQSFCFRGEEDGLAERRQDCFERYPLRPDAQVDVLPIIKSRTSHLAFIEREAQRFDQVECCADCETRSTGVARVPVNLGM